MTPSDLWAGTEVKEEVIAVMQVEAKALRAGLWQWGSGEVMGFSASPQDLMWGREKGHLCPEQSP